MTNPDKKQNIKVISAFAAIYVIWGTTYLAIKIGLEAMPPFVMATFRYLIAGAAILVYGILKNLPVFNKGFVRNLLLGSWMLTSGQGILVWAQQYLPSGLTAVLIATLPVWYVLNDYRHWKNNFRSTRMIISIIMGLLGIIMLFIDKQDITSGTSGNMKIIASVVVIMSCICWALGSVYYKNYHKDGSLLNDVGWQLIGAAISCCIIAVFRREFDGFRLTAVSYQVWLAVLYLAIAGSVIALSACYYLLSVRPASVVGSYAYVNPVVAVLIGWLFASETLTLNQAIGITVILIAAYLSNKARLTDETSG